MEAINSLAWLLFFGVGLVICLDQMFEGWNEWKKARAEKLKQH